MIEAVGYEFWATYFQTIDPVLAPGGRVAIQAITMPHDRMLATRDTYTWINKYIFPGGFLPSVEVDRRDHPRRTPALRLTDRLSMGSHYAETLRLWDEPFLAAPRRRARPRLRRRSSCGCGTSTSSTPAPASPRGYIDVQQLTFVKGAPRDDHDRAAPPRPRPGVAHAARRGAPARSSAATCRCACRPGTAPSPAPTTRRSVVLRSPDAAAPAALAPGRARGRPGLRHRRARRPRAGRRPRRRAHPRFARRRRSAASSGVRRSPRALVDALRTAAGARRARPPAGAARVARPAQGPAAQPLAATGRRSATTTTSPTSSTR